MNADRINHLHDVIREDISDLQSFEDELQDPSILRGGFGQFIKKTLTFLTPRVQVMSLELNIMRKKIFW